MKRKVCIVVASPMTLRTLIAPHVAALKNAYEVTAVANLPNGESSPVGPDVAFVSLPIERRIAPMRDLEALIKLVRLFRKSAFAAVQSVTPKAGLLAMVASFLSRVPVRVHIFTGQVWATRKGAERWFLKRMDRFTAWCATHILVDSCSQRDFLVANHVVNAAKALVLASGSISGVDPARFRPDKIAKARVRSDLGVREDAILFLYVGRLSRDKGLLDLAVAFAAIADQDARAELVLIGPDEDGLLLSIGKLIPRCASRVHWFDYTDAPETYMAAADVFCLPSYREGFGQVAIEASATGLPVIASRIYGVTDAVVEGETGLLHAPGDVGALTERMQTLIEHPEMRRSLGSAGRDRVLREFSAERVTRALLDYYSALPL